MYALVIVDNPGLNTDKPFHYRIPDRLAGDLRTGSRVAVPFGVSDRVLEGYVVGVSPRCPVDEDKTKEVIDIIDRVPIFSEELVSLAGWMKENYLSTWADALQCIMPSHIKKKGRRMVALTGEETGRRENKAYRTIVEALRDAGGKMEFDRLKTLVSIRGLRTIIKEMIEEGVLTEDFVMDAPVNPKYLLYAKLIAGSDDWQLPRNAVRQKSVLLYLEEAGEDVSCSEVMEATGAEMSVLYALQKKSLVRIYKKRVERIPGIQTGLVNDRVERLTSQQKDAVAKIKQMYDAGTREILLHGVTGSGKTEVYMRLIGDTVKKGKKAIVLVPEISLTPQMVEWYHRRFQDRAALFHSKLSPGERYDQWEGIRRGEFDVAIGARSAVFAPFKDIGLIIIDEEHEYTYKSETSPRFHTRDVARERCRYYDGLLVLGSATPSMETYHRAARNEIGLVQLSERVESRPLPHVHIVDMREELREGNRSVFSRLLQEEMKNTLDRGEQVMLLLNRRGYSTYVSCRDCGAVIKCPSCDISLTYHSQGNWLLCHYCGYRERMPENCRECGSGKIKYMGTGTQKLEKEVSRIFPGVRILRMDVDTTRKKGEHFRILKAFKNKEAEILLGTQMIAKGLDFPAVTLVGVILADFSLNIPDFRSAERTFQLLTQVSGRAGRGEAPGEVVVQTYSPQHYSIRAAQHHHFAEFYKNEIQVREQFGYPPFSELLNIMVTGANAERVVKGCRMMYEKLEKSLKSMADNRLNIYGPSPALHSKIKNRYRWQIIIKAGNMEIIKEEVKKIRFNLMQKLPKGVNIIVDVGPYQML